MSHDASFVDTQAELSERSIPVRSSVTRWSGVGVVIVCLLLPLGTGATAAAHQALSSAGAAAVEINLQATSAFPGGQLTIPIELRPGHSRPVGSIAFSVSVPEGMTLKGGDVAYGLEAEDGTIAADLATGGDRVNVVVKAGKTPLADGVLAYLTFIVPIEAPVATRPVQAADAVVKTPTGERVQPATITAGDASIVDPLSAPVVACFFYMH